MNFISRQKWHIFAADVNEELLLFFFIFLQKSTTGIQGHSSCSFR